MGDTMSAAERVRRSRWAGQVESAAERLHRLLLDAPIPMPKEPVIDLDLIDALMALCDYPNGEASRTEPQVKFQAPEKNQRDWMREIAEEFDYDEAVCIQRYAELDEQGIAPRKRRNMPSPDYAAALWKDGVKKGWLGLKIKPSSKARSRLNEESRMMRKAFRQEEIVLCTYLALYGASLLSEPKIANYGGRSTGSVRMKIQNIVAMLDENGIERHPGITPLSGRPLGESGRETNWAQVEQLAELEKAELWGMCKEILAASR